jgi:chromosomal replication initiation ATPase DnaA
MVKLKREFLREEKTEEQKLLETIDGLLPELIHMRDNLNSVIMEMSYYRTARQEKTHVKIAKIIMAAVTDYFGIFKSQIESKSRDMDIRMARQIYMALTKELTTLSFAKVGATIGKDHATVMHAQKVVNNSTDPIHEHYIIIKHRVSQAMINVEAENKKEGLL